MSSEHIHSVYNTKKLKLDDVTEIESCIAEYKRRAILKYCKENGISKIQCDEQSILGTLLYLFNNNS